MKRRGPAARSIAARRRPSNARRSALYGFEARKAVALQAAGDAAAKAADYRPETLAWDIAGGAVHIAGPGGSEALAYDGLILATGAMDRIIPIPGWTLPGVFTLGGAQVALKAQGCAIGRRCILLGTGPLLYLLAFQYAKAGAVVAAVLDTARAEARFRALPKLLAQPATLAKGLHYTIWLRARGIPLWDGIQPIEILGGTSAAGIRFRDRTGAEREIQGDAVAMGFGLKPETQLADLAGCAFGFDEASRQFLPLTDGEGRARGAAGVYLAGDGAGIAGADAAELAGEQAALDASRRPRHSRQQRQAARDPAPARPDRALPSGVGGGLSLSRRAGAQLARCGDPLPLRGRDRRRAPRHGREARRRRSTGPRLSAASAWGAARAGSAPGPRRRSWRPRAASSSPPSAGCAASRR